MPGVATGPAMVPRNLEGIAGAGGLTDPFVILDYFTRSLSGEAVPGAANTYDATMAVPQAWFGLLLDRAFIRTVSATASTIAVYVGDATEENQRSYSDEGDLNEAEWSVPIFVPGGATLRFRWEGISGAGLRAIVNLQGRILARRD